METRFRMTDSEFREAFYSHKDVLYRFAYRMTGSHDVAEDTVQDVFAALWKGAGNFDTERGGLRSYLLGITRNLVLKHWRGRHPDQSPNQSIEEEAFVCLPIDLERLELSEAVAEAVRMLPPLQREALILAEYEEMPLFEIALATGSELAAVKSRLHRARENLRRALRPLLEPKGA